MTSREETKKVRLTLFITPEAKKQAQLLAINAGTTVSQLFENLINGGKNAK